MTVDSAPVPFTIAFAEGVTLTRWTGAWAERHRDIPLAFVPVDGETQVSVLREARADVSFVRLPIERDGLSVIPLYTETPVVVVPKDHPVSLFATVTLADLATEDRVPDSLSSADAVELVAAGGGILVLPQSLARLHARKDVVARPVTDAEETHIALAWLEEATTPQIEEFVGIVRGRTAHSSRSPAQPTPAQQPATESKSRAQPTRRTAAQRPQRPRKSRGR